MENLSFETRQIHAGQKPDSETFSRALPIYQTTSYTFKDSQHAANLFSLAEMGNIYTRIMNPTQATVEERIASLENGIGALLTSSGQSAEVLAILNLASCGDHIVSSPSLYGGTFNLFKYTLPKLGIEVTFVEDPDDLNQWQNAIKPNTKAFYGETVGNPKNDILDIEGISKVAHENGIPLIVDNTVPTPYLIKPIDLGADIVVHSATKYLSGHGTVIGGVIIDSGKFDWASSPERFPDFVNPDPSYHGIVYSEALGPMAYIIKARITVLRDIGAAISPFNAFLIAQGLETLSLRMERHVYNAQVVAEWLETNKKVKEVYFAGLKSSKWYQRGKKYNPNGTSAIVSFEIEGGKEAGAKFVDSLELHSHVANIGDVRSLVIHPASTTHSQLTEEEQEKSGVTAGLVRLSVGTENIKDIIEDLEKGFKNV